MRSRALHAKWFDGRQVDPGAAGARPRAMNLRGRRADEVRRWSSSAASSRTRRLPKACQASSPATALRSCAAPPLPTSSFAAAKRVVRSIRRRVVHRDTAVRSRRCGVERWSSE
ncbi:hypothetical protein EV121DRAFT_275407 [Schizophyllum commune]